MVQGRGDGRKVTKSLPDEYFILNLRMKPVLDCAGFIMRGQRMDELKISLIVTCKNEDDYIRQTLISILENSGQIPFRIIVVDDGSTDGCCDFLRSGEKPGITLLTTGGVYTGQARNIGAAEAGGDILVFCDAHIYVEKNWLTKLVAPLQLPGVDAVAPGIRPHDYEGPAWGGITWEADMTSRWLFCATGLTPVPVLPRNCLAVTRAAFAAIGGFDNGLKGYGYDDIEFSLKLWLWGFGAFITPDVTIRHVFRRPRSYQVNVADVDYNLLRLAVIHFNQERLGRVINLVKNKPHFPEVFTDVVLGDALRRREACLNRRKYDDDWFVRKFNIPL